MDTYGKGILTIIAILLAVIAVGVWMPYVQKGHVGQQPTLGDMLRLRDIRDPELHQKTRLELIRSIPYVEVWGTVDVGQVHGTVDVGQVYGTVDVDR